tara:strand:- start:118 stop:348 length:231 start_codon:yes stop_codon:yes gene_type:complete
VGLVILNQNVEVCLCEDGFWKHDTVFIYNDSKCIAEREIKTIMQYLYDEGFIRDRRTKYFIAEKKGENGDGDAGSK